MRGAQTRLPEGDHQSCLHPSALLGGWDSESGGVWQEGRRDSGMNQASLDAAALPPSEPG